MTTAYPEHYEQRLEVALGTLFLIYNYTVHGVPFVVPFGSLLLASLEEFSGDLDVAGLCNQLRL